MPTNDPFEDFRPRTPTEEKEERQKSDSLLVPDPFADVRPQFQDTTQGFADVAPRIADPSDPFTAFRPEKVSPGLVGQGIPATDLFLDFRPTVDPTSFDQLRAEVSLLEQEAEKVGVLERIGRNALSILGPVIDVVASPNFAIAGAADEVLENVPQGDRKQITSSINQLGFGGLLRAASPVGGVAERAQLASIAPTILRNALIQGTALAAPDSDLSEDVGERVLSELGAGLATLTNAALNAPDLLLPGNLIPDDAVPTPEGAERTGFSQIMEQFGIDDLGRLSEFAPILFNETGEGIHQFKKGGLFDFTGRGAIGLSGDIFLDPLTYVTFGTSGGIKTTLTTGGKELTKKTLTKEGAKRLTSFVQRSMGMTDEGLQSMRAGLYSALPNKNGQLALDIADSNVQEAFREVTKRTLDDARLPRLKLTDLTSEELQAVSLAARRSAEMRLSSLVMSDPARYRAWFDDGGIKFLGGTIPGTDNLQRWMSQVSADVFQKLDSKLLQGLEREIAGGGRGIFRRTIDTSRKTAGLLNSFVKLFRRDKTNDPIFQSIKQRVIDEDAMVRAELATELEQALGKKQFDLKPQQWEEVVRVIDTRRRNLGLELGRLGVRPLDIKEGVHLSPADARRIASNLAPGQPMHADAVLEGLRSVIVNDLKAKRVAGKLPKKMSDQDIFDLSDFVVSFTHRLDGIEFERFRGDMRSIGLLDSQIKAIETETANIVKQAVNASKEDLVGQIKGIRQGALDVPAIAEEVGRIINSDAAFNSFFDLTEAQREAVKRYAAQVVNRTYLSNIPVFMRNRSANITQIFNVLRKSKNIASTEDTLLGRHRAFYSPAPREEIMRGAAQMRLADKAFPDGRVVSDLREILTRRIDLHVEDDLFRKWQGIMQKFDIDRLPAGTWDSFRDLNAPPNLDQKVIDQVDNLYNKWSVGAKPMLDDMIRKNRKGPRQTPFGATANIHDLPDTLKGKFAQMSVEEQRYWLSKEFSTAVNRRDMQNIMNRYVEFIAKNPEIMPKFRSLEAFRKSDFTSSIPLNIQGSIRDRMVEVPAEFFDDFTSMKRQLFNSRELASILVPWDRLNNWFKTGVTAPFPSFHFRNWYGNVSLAFTDIALGAFNPKTHRLALAVTLRGMKNKGMFRRRAFARGALGVGRKTSEALGLAVREGKLDDLRLVTKTGEIYDVAAIEDLAKQLGIWTDDIRLFELADEFPEAGAGKVKRGLKRAGENVRLTGTAIENEARMQLFIQHLQRGLSPEDAAAAVKKFLFDYDNLSPLERNFFRRVVPFWVFFRKNLPLQVEQLVKRPGRASAQFKTLQQREEENDMLSVADVDGSLIRLDRDGKNLTVLSGVDLPVTQLNYFDAILTNNTRRQRELLSMLQPLIRGPVLELPLNTNFLTGRDLNRAESQAAGRFVEAVAPKGIKDWLGYRKDLDPFTGKPRYTFDGKKFFVIFQMWAQSRALRTSDKFFEERMLRDQDPNLLQWFLTGTRTETLNLDTEEFKSLQKRRKLINEELERRGLKRQIDVQINAPEEAEF